MAETVNTCANCGSDCETARYLREKGCNVSLLTCHAWSEHKPIPDVEKIRETIRHGIKTFGGKEEFISFLKLIDTEWDTENHKLGRDLLVELIWGFSEDVEST